VSPPAALVSRPVDAAAHPNAVIPLVPSDLKLADRKPLVEPDFVARVLREPSGRRSPAKLSLQIFLRSCVRPMVRARRCLLSMIYDSEFATMTRSFPIGALPPSGSIFEPALDQRVPVREPIPVSLAIQQASKRRLSWY
jgi:hypothetical protein